MRSPASLAATGGTAAGWRPGDGWRPAARRRRPIPV